MLQLGLGLGLGKGQMLKSFAKLVKDAGGVLYLDARKADGSAPLTGNSSPWVDLSGNGNNGTLTNFAGSVTSGWQAEPSVLRFEGVDDFVGFANTAILNITTAPLALGVTLKVTTDDTGFILSKNVSSFSNVQYSLYHKIGRTIEFSSGGLAYAQAVFDTSNYVNVLFYWDGVNVSSYENSNSTPKSQTALVGTLISAGNLNLGKIIEGTYLASDIATVTIYTGSDINKILAAEAKISAQYLALNP